MTALLVTWAESDGRGEAFDSSAQFILPDGSALSPDTSWVSPKSSSELTLKQRKKFRLAPEFVVEVLSPSDRLKSAKAKMEHRMEKWIANGVLLAWLIDGDSKTVYVYRKSHPAKTRRNLQQIAGEGPVEGFVLQLTAIWKGLS